MAGTTVLHYEIVERIGAGAMGVVWKAVDTRLAREVALKFLPDSATTDPVRLERLIREARAASALNHPNIVTIYEINSDGDRHFIAMELIHGRALSDVLRGGKPFPVGEAVGYMIQFADGLAKAHAAHIVHRDIKPSNIMLTDDGLIKILDFGLARSIAETSPLDATLAASTLTGEGVVMGTVPYMSPEQAAGEVVGPRSDVFSSGIVFYEMLTGSRPFDGPSRTAVMEAVLRADPTPLRLLAATVPDELAAIVHTCLRKAPEARYATASELALHLRSFDRYSSGGQRRASAEEERPTIRTGIASWLRRPVVAMVIVLSLLLGGYAAWSTRPTASDSSTSVGADALRTAQAYLHRYDRKGNIDRAIAILEPALLKDASNAALHATLSEAYLLKYTTLNDRVWLQKASESARLAVAANGDLAAAHVAQGRALGENGQNDQAVTALQHAIALDQLSSPAHVAMARVRFAQGKLMEAVELSETAVKLAPDDWIPLTGLGLFYYRGARYGEALDAWRRALQLTPDNLVILRNLAAGYFQSGEYAQAAATFQRSLELDQTNANTYNNLGTARYFTGQFTEAAAACEKAVEIAPTNYLYWGNLGDAYRWAPGLRHKAADAYRTAIRFAREKLALNSNDTAVRSSLALYLAKSGDTTAAVSEVQQIERTPSGVTPETLFKLAVVYEFAHNQEQAFDALRRAIAGGYSKAMADREPEISGLRTDPRYATLAAGSAAPAK